MKRKFFVLGILAVALLGIAAAAPGIPVLTASAIGDDCDIGYQHSITIWADSAIVSKAVICPVIGVVTTFESVDGLNVSNQHVSTAYEASVYSGALEGILFDAAAVRLVTDVEVGENWVNWLRNKSDLYEAHAADWDNKNTSQKLSVLQAKIEIDAKVLNGLADLLVTLGYLNSDD